MQIVLILLIALASLHASAQQADDQPEQCLAPPSRFDPALLMAKGEIKVNARRATIIQDESADFSGDVSIVSDSAQISAQRAQVAQAGKQLVAEGQVSYRDAQIQVSSESVRLDSEAQSLNMEQTEYRLTGFTGHGAAQRIVLSREQGLSLQDVSFTTCPINSTDWQIQASEISIEPGEIWGKARNTRFYIADVPVFYLPYFAFPVSPVRQTGFLFPQVSSSSATGIDYEQPFYWNIAPNYDATISPRVMTNRGIQLKTEFRYLTESHRGTINLEYLPDDRDSADRSNRYFYRFEHHGQLSDNWVLSADINGLSDDNYIVDLGSDFYNRADTHLYQTVAMSYYSNNLDVVMRVRDFEVIGEHADTYRTLPELQLDYVTSFANGLDFRVDSELAYFDNQIDGNPSALRIHFAPSLSLPYQRQWGEFLAEASLLSTYYHQRDIEGTPLADEVARNLGRIKLYGGLNFEREADWFGEASTMTLEPKLQYLFTSYEDQTDIGLYDTTRLLNDYTGLFRGQEFTGLDRISDNNQVTLGVTSRILDAASREQFVFSVGQIFYLSDNKVLAANKADDRSALAAELDWRLHSKWFMHADIQVSTRTDKVERSSLSLEYRRDDKRLVQLNHRYVRDLSGEQIDQLGISASWPIAKNWQWVGRWYKDLSQQRTIESYTGIQYESCCWALRFVAQRHLSNRYDATGLQRTDEFDSGIALQFIFKGMGSSSSKRAMLEDGMFGYRQPYVLN
ncbi:LPS-assembly protein LptD [Aestuariibacter salexigens]|uniref:LPS-assembly protein LptD n=1 Tax=Aestuariibacter salexigens TaxID=226010 RepID=UPI0003F58A4E|nr:LPS assembly protein LptD [Aestuariibacter salexigens]